jgi:hypothetical protein
MPLIAEILCLRRRLFQLEYVCPCPALTLKRSNPSTFMPRAGALENAHTRPERHSAKSSSSNFNQI